MAAADELHLSASAVSHRVRSLERQLGIELFIRLARRVELTDHGRSYMPAVRKAFDELAVSTAGLFGSARPIGRLTVRVPISYAVSVVAPRLWEFTARHPTIEIRLVSAIWADAMTPDDIDVDIRFGIGDWPGHTSEVLNAESATAVWSPGFEQRHGPFATASDLWPHPRVHVLGLENLWVDLSGPDNPAFRAADVTVDTSLAAIELALSGSFSAVVPSRFVTRYLADGRLHTQVGVTTDMTEGHFVVRPMQSQSTSTAALLFIDWLRATTA